MSVPQSAAVDLKSQLEKHLQDDLQHVNAILSSQLKSPSEFVTDVTDHISHFRGKQIRPVLLLLMHRMLAVETTRKAQMLAAAMEMIHTATLVHDDVIDDAETRRHIATVHRRWNTETSVLLGDYLFSKAFHLTASTGDAEACRLIGMATDRTCEGELNQSALRTNHNLTELDYFRVIRDKTGQLFAVSCLLGVRAAGGTPGQQRAARRFGQRLGMAFQIADDLLDLTGDTNKTGKDHSNDLQNGRTTLPILRAIRLANTQERTQLLRRLSENGLSAADVRSDPILLQGMESATATASEMTQRAIRDLRFFPESADRAMLEAIASFIVQRSG